MTVIPPGFAEVVNVFDIAGPAGPALVVFGVDPATETDPTVIASDIGPMWDTTVGPLKAMHSSVTLTEVRVTLGQDGGPPTVGAATFSLQGDVAGNGMTPQVTYLIKKVTGFGGRAFRGRMYWPGVQEEAISDSGSISATLDAALLAAADEFLDTLDTGGYPMVLLHTDGLIAPTPVTALIPDGRVATQRRRVR